MALHMLTTVDNPFDPVTEWDEWVAWDETCGYYTNDYLARVAHTSLDLPDADQELVIEQAIDEIVRENANGLYRKVEIPLESVA
jgi:hypothetical protein